MATRKCTHSTRPQQCLCWSQRWFKHAVSSAEIWNSTQHSSRPLIREVWESQLRRSNCPNCSRGERHCSDLHNSCRHGLWCDEGAGSKECTWLCTGEWYCKSIHWWSARKRLVAAIPEAMAFHYCYLKTHFYFRSLYIQPRYRSACVLPLYQLHF